MARVEQAVDRALAIPPESRTPLDGLGATLLRVAWLSIILGVAMEILLLVVAVGFGTAESAPPFVADLVQKTSWSTLVCMGLA